MTISIRTSPISSAHIPYRQPISHIDIRIEISLMSDLPYRSPISILDHISSPCYEGVTEVPICRFGRIFLTVWQCRLTLATPR